LRTASRLRKRSLLARRGQYATASWLGILLQYALTLWLTHLGLHDPDRQRHRHRDCQRKQLRR
jgi:hypothetical protein